MLHLQTKRSWFKPHCPQTCKNMCRPLKNPGKKLKRLMINSIQVNLKNCNHIPLATICEYFQDRSTGLCKLTTWGHFNHQPFSLDRFVPL